MQRFLSFTVLFAASLAAQAQPAVDVSRSTRQGVDGSLAARGATQFNGSQLDAVRRGNAVSDGQGNAAAWRGGAFTTADGTQGQRSTQYRRSDDGSVDASRNGSVSGDKGSAESSRSYERSADGRRVYTSLRELVERTRGATMARADLHLGLSRDGEIFVTSRQDGTIRMLVPDE